MAAEEKTYLEVEVVEIIDRDTEEGEAAWMAMTDHHLFWGNHSMMIFGRFWGDDQSYEELLSFYNEYPEEKCDFTLFITKWLEENGHSDYPHEKVLLNIHW